MPILKQRKPALAPILTDASYIEAKVRAIERFQA
jgi:hypothetical protein